MEFTTAYILGVQRRNDYFGERTAQYRSVDTISIEGYIDVRSDNTDFKGVRQTLSRIDSYVNAAAASNAVTENIIINGTGFGTGRLVNINFPASQSIEENQILYGKYSADIEIYNSGNISNTFDSPTRTLSTVTADDSTDVFTKSNHGLLDGLEVEITSMTGAGPTLNNRYHVGNVTANTFKLYEDSARTILVDVTSDPFTCTLKVYYVVPFPQYLESFSEDFSISLDQNDVYNLTHSLDITYLSGVEGGGDAIDPIATAKSLAVNLFEQTPTQFSTVIPNSYGSISEASRKYFTESYNLIDGSSTFEKKFSLLPSGLSTYSLQLSNNFSFDQAGIVTVSEDGEIQPRSPQFLTEAREALDTELSKSYDRCSTIYDSYKNYLGANSSTLYNRPITKSKTINDSEGKSSYTVEFTDNQNVKNLDRIEERSIQVSTSDNVTSYSENGTVTSINFKGVSFDPYSLIPDRSIVKSRCTELAQNLYSNRSAGEFTTLANLSNKVTIPKYGKQITYSYTFTDDREIKDRADDPVFARKKITHSDKIGVPNQSSMIIPNFDTAILHTPDQTSLATRSTSFEAQLRRAEFTNNLDTRPSFSNAINTAKTECLQDAYRGLIDNNLIRTLDAGQVYVTNASYSMTSENVFTMSVDSTFTMQRLVNNGEYNLVFEGVQTSPDITLTSVTGVYFPYVGSGYSVGPFLSFQGGNPQVPASGFALINANGQVTGAFFTAGQGYQSTPIIQLINIGSGVTNPASGIALMA